MGKRIVLYGKPSRYKDTATIFGLHGRVLNFIEADVNNIFAKITGKKRVKFKKKSRRSLARKA